MKLGRLNNIGVATQAKCFHMLVQPALIAAAIGTAPAIAGTFVSGGVLLRTCDSKDPGADELCIGYIAGVADAHDDLNSGAGKGIFCAPANVNPGLYRDIVVAYLRAHPDGKDYSASSQVMVALMDKFPCKK